MTLSVCVYICVYACTCVCLCVCVLHSKSEWCELNWTACSTVRPVWHFRVPVPVPPHQVVQFQMSRLISVPPSLMPPRHPPPPQPCCIVLCWTKRALSWLWLGASLWQLSTKWNYIVNKLATLPVQCWKATTTATATTTGRTLFVSILISICRFQTSACELNVLTTSI